MDLDSLMFGPSLGSFSGLMFAHMSVKMGVATRAIFCRRLAIYNCCFPVVLLFVAWTATVPSELSFAAAHALHLKTPLMMHTIFPEPRDRHEAIYSRSYSGNRNNDNILLNDNSSGGHKCAASSSEQCAASGAAEESLFEAPIETGAAENTEDNSRRTDAQRCLLSTSSLSRKQQTLGPDVAGLPLSCAQKHVVGATAVFPPVRSAPNQRRQQRQQASLMSLLDGQGKDFDAANAAAAPAILTNAASASAVPTDATGAAGIPRKHLSFLEALGYAAGGEAAALGAWDWTSWGAGGLRLFQWLPYGRSADSAAGSYGSAATTTATAQETDAEANRRKSLTGGSSWMQRVKSFFGQLEKRVEESGGMLTFGELYEFTL